MRKFNLDEEFGEDIPVVPGVPSDDGEEVAFPENDKIDSVLERMASLPCSTMQSRRS